MARQRAVIAQRDTEHDRATEDMRADVPVVAKEEGGQGLEPMRLVARGAAAIKRTYRMADLSRLEPSLQPDSFHDASYEDTLTCGRRGGSVGRKI